MLQKNIIDVWKYEQGCRKVYFKRHTSSYKIAGSWTETKKQNKFV